MSYTLIIDGTFMAQRNRSAGGFTFLTNPDRDRSELLESLANSVALEVRRLGSIVHRVVWCLDYSSWRKKLTPVLPLETEKTEDEGDYKANRDHSSYNAEAFFRVVDEFTSMLSSLGVCVIKQYGCEADDSAYITSRLLAEKGLRSILWSSDEDFKSFVDPLVWLYKLPKKEIYKTIDKQVSMMESVFGSGAKRVDQSQKIIESVGGSKNVHEVNPMTFVFEQCIRGQGKDNIPPVFFWKSKVDPKKPDKVLRTFKPSWKHMTKACEAMNFNIESIKEEDLYNEDFIKKFIAQVLIVTKQERDIDHCYEVYKSSRKLAFVSKKEIPEEVYSKCTATLIEEFKNKKLKAKLITSGQNILNHSKANDKPVTTGFMSSFDLDEIEIE